jgi:hypothetical protein
MKWFEWMLLGALLLNILINIFIMIYIGSLTYGFA